MEHQVKEREDAFTTASQAWSNEKELAADTLRRKEEAFKQESEAHEATKAAAAKEKTDAQTALDEA